MAVTSIRSLAALLNVSSATVSDSLRGSPRVKDATRRRVIEEAERQGYRLHPAVSELMGRMRRSESNVFRGLITSVLPDHLEPSSSSQVWRAALMRAAVERRATELGFKMDFMTLSPSTESWQQLPDVLNARGVVGLLLFPSDKITPLHRARFSSEKYGTVQIDAVEESAEHIDVVAPDYHHVATLLAHRLRASGYRRPGIVLKGSPFAPANIRWLGAGASIGKMCDPDADPALPFWIVDGSTPKTELSRWAKKCGLDVVITTTDLSGKTDLPVITLDTPPNSVAKMGLNLRWDEIAARAVDIIARKHFDRLCSRTECPALAALPPRWHQATTIQDSGASQLAARTLNSSSGS